MVSEDCSFLTRLFSFFIFITEKAKDKVTANGRPSGTAMTITVIPVIMTLIISSVVFFDYHSSSNHPRVLSTNLLITRLPAPATIAISAQ